MEIRGKCKKSVAPLPGIETEKQGGENIRGIKTGTKGK
jgi:hypothetical protein